MYSCRCMNVVKKNTKVSLIYFNVQHFIQHNSRKQLTALNTLYKLWQ